MTMLRRERDNHERLTRDRERIAKASADARGPELKTALSASGVRLRLVEGSLETEDSKKFMESMPTAVDLMPQLSLPQIEEQTGRYQYGTLQ
jgi:hypothetical protein